MPLSRSARRLYFRCALAIAWVAMCLLFAGPLISQFQTQFQISQHQQHAQGHHELHQHSHGELTTSSFNSADSRHDSSSNALTNWHTQCGYCELWQHSPSLSIALPAIAHEALITLNGLFLAPQAGALFQYNYPHALTRGPPRSSNVIKTTT